MADKDYRFGPLALTTSAANLVNPGTTTGGTNSTSAPYDKLKIVLRHIRIVNKTASAVTFSMYLGATGASVAGTEVIGTALSVAANSAYDYYGKMTLYSGDFLVGLASANTSLTIEGEGEIAVA